MKRLIVVIGFVFVGIGLYAQTIQGTEKFKVVDGDTIWSPTIDQIKTYVQATAGTVTSITLTQPAAGFTISGSGVAITTTGTPTFALSDDLAAVEGLATTGIVRRTASNTWSAGTTVAATEGGTGQTSYAVGDLLYASSTTALSKLAGVAAGQPLLSGGVNTAPAYAGYTFSGTAAQTYTFPTTSKTLMANDYSNAGTAPTWNQNTTGNAATATSATTSTNIAGGAAGGVLYQSAASTTAHLAAGTSAQVLIGGATSPAWTAISGLAVGSATTATTATNATNSAITDATTDATMYPVWVTANTGNLPLKVTSGKLTFNASSGLLTSTSISAAGTTTVAAVAAAGVSSRGVTAFTTGPQTLSGLHSEVNVTCSSASITINLPSPAAGNNGWTYTINKEDATAHYIVVAGTFNTGTNRVISGQGTSVVVQSNGTNWRVVN